MTPLNLQSWSQRARLAHPRAGCAAGVLADKLIVAGGTYWLDGKKFWDVRVDAFDARANHWVALAPLPQPRGDAAALAVGDSFYVFGGGAEGGAESSVMCYQSGAWRELLAMKLLAPRRSSAVAMLDGTIYLLGGLAGTGSDFAAATATVWAAQPGGAWQARAPMPGPVRFSAAVGAVGGLLIVAGGCTPDEGKVRNLDDILSYNPRTDRWSVIGHLPGALRGACGLVVQNRLLVVGGYTDQFITQILSIDPLTGLAATAGILPLGLADTRFFQVGAEIVGVTGENGVKMRFPETLAATLP